MADESEIQSDNNITRRPVLKGIAALGITAVVSATGCAKPESAATTPPVTTPPTTGTSGYVTEGKFAAFYGNPNNTDKGNLNLYSLTAVEPSFTSASDVNNSMAYGSLTGINTSNVKQHPDSKLAALFTKIMSLKDKNEAANGFLKDINGNIQTRPNDPNNSIYMVDLRSKPVQDAMHDYLVDLATSYPKGVFMDEMDYAIYVEYLQHVSATGAVVQGLSKAIYSGDQESNDATVHPNAITVHPNTIEGLQQLSSVQRFGNDTFLTKANNYFSSINANAGGRETPEDVRPNVSNPTGYYDGLTDATITLMQRVCADVALSGKNAVVNGGTQLRWDSTKQDALQAVMQSTNMIAKESIYYQSTSDAQGNTTSVTPWAGADLTYIQGRMKAASDYAKAAGKSTIQLLAIEPCLNSSPSSVISAVKTYYNNFITGLTGAKFTTDLELANLNLTTSADLSANLATSLNAANETPKLFDKFRNSERGATYAENHRARELERKNGGIISLGLNS